MNMFRELYKPTMALFTDLYQLTMAYGYWKTAVADREAVFHLFFRKSPFGGEFSIVAGLEAAVEFLDGLRFSHDDIRYLSGLCGNDQQPLFSPEFLETLLRLRFTCDLDAVPEGTVVFPHEPLIRVMGPLLQCQLLETPLLNLINFPTLVATKAARVKLAAGEDAVIEFGLRRAQGVDGGITASRAAYLGGCEATSNVMAGRLFGIPVRGTHAHSWVTAFDSESEAFDAYSSAMPNNCIFLVDTYDTLEGVRRASRAAKGLRDRGHEMVGIRLDSGNLAQLSRKARRILDEAGFPTALIVASSNLDEYQILKLKKEGAKIDVWGVGTRLATAFDQPALNGVYKMSAIRDSENCWKHRLKLSEQRVKTNDPGILQVRRFLDHNRFIKDMIYDETLGVSEHSVLVSRSDPDEIWPVGAGLEFMDLLVPVIRSGERVAEVMTLAQARERARDQLGRLPEEIKTLTGPSPYPVGLEGSLARRREELIREVVNCAGAPRLQSRRRKL